MQILLSASEVFACSILYGKGDENYETVKKVIVDYDVCWYSSVTACAGNSNDNGAGQNDVVNDNGANDTQTGDSAMDKIGDGLEDGIDDVGKGVGDVVDDLDGDGRSDNRKNTNNNTVNDATTGNDNVNDR